MEQWTCSNIKNLIVVVAISFIIILYSLSGNREPAKIPGPRRMLSKRILLHKVVTTMDQNFNSTRVEAKKLIDHSRLQCMTQGYWVDNDISSEYEEELLEYYFKVRLANGIRPSLERADGVCGNVTFPGSHFRAVCDQYGWTPCCYHGTCVYRDIEDCLCDECWDHRTYQYAELSTFKTHNHKCQYKEYTTKEVCNLLDGGTIVIFGDSLMRQLYIALAMLAIGRMHGVILNTDDIDVINKCHGPYLLVDNYCRKHLNHTASACNGQVTIRYMDHPLSSSAVEAMKLIEQYSNSSRTLIVYSFGIHDSCDHGRVIHHWAKPVANVVNNNPYESPHVLWLTLQKPGMLKSPQFPLQRPESVRWYNANMTSFMNSKNIPVMDFYNLTEHIISLDGTHFGMGVNLLKSQMLMNYISELQGKGQW